jgi:hypothetical protein
VKRQTASASEITIFSQAQPVQNRADIGRIPWREDDEAGAQAVQTQARWGRTVPDAGTPVGKTDA